MMPQASACAEPNAYSSSVNALSLAINSRPTIRPASSSLMLMSWPVCALVAGVNSGAGSRSDSRNPGGSGMLHTEPVATYSFHPEPDKYPRATHSTGTGSVRVTSIDRPRKVSASRRSVGGYSSTFVVIT
jgi:hypothetical protein